MEIDDERPLAKRARTEGPAFAYLCRACEERILARHGRQGEHPNPLLNGRLGGAAGAPNPDP